MDLDDIMSEAKINHNRDQTHRVPSQHYHALPVEVPVFMSGVFMGPQLDAELLHHVLSNKMQEDISAMDPQELKMLSIAAVNVFGEEQVGVAADSPVQAKDNDPVSYLEYTAPVQAYGWHVFLGVRMYLVCGLWRKTTQLSKVRRRRV